MTESSSSAGSSKGRYICTTYELARKGGVHVKIDDTLYQYINSLYSFVKSCDVDEDALILDKLEEDARSLIKVIGEKRSARTRELAGV